MVKKLFFVLFLAIAGIAGVNAQVRIGGSEAPNKSAVLDLNPDDRVSEGNATLGLALPRVRLKNTASPYPLLTHVKGMSVYNISEEGDVTPGVYIANGSRWVRQADSESLENLATNIYRAVFSDTIISYITGHMDNTSLMDSVINRITGNNGYIEELISSISSNIYSTVLGDTVMQYITQNLDRSALMDNVASYIRSNNEYLTQLIDNIARNVYTTTLGDTIVNYVTQHIATTELGDTVMQYITQNLDRSALMDSVAGYISNNNEYIEQLINGISANIYNTVLGDSILEYITQNIHHTALGDSVVTLIHENESDGIVGNEVTGATANGGLVRSGAGTAVSPYTLGIASGGVANANLANNAVSVEKISDSAVTSGKIADGAITNADINALAAISLNKIALPDASANNGKVLKSNGTAWIAGDDNNTDANTTYTAGNGLTLAGTAFSIGAGQVNGTMIADNAVTSAKIIDGTISNSDISTTAGIAGSKLADKSVAIAKVNAAGTASSITYLRGDGLWATPEVDGQGVTSVSGANGITVSNSATTPTVSLPAGVTSGNVLKWNGTAWGSAADAGITGEQDGIIGNEVSDATTGGGLIRSGLGTSASPYTLGIASGGVTNSHIAENAVNSSKIADNTVTSAKIADGTIANADINASAAIALNKIALPDASTNNGKVLKSNGTAWVAGDDSNTDSNTTYTAGSGLTLTGYSIQYRCGTGKRHDDSRQCCYFCKNC
jgi:hypothetical protein